MSYIVKFFTVLAMTSILAIDANVLKSDDGQYVTVYQDLQEKNSSCQRSKAINGESYACDNIHGSITNGKKSGQYDEAKEKFEKLECKWCKEQKKPYPRTNSQCGNQ